MTSNASTRSKNYKVDVLLYKIIVLRTPAYKVTTITSNCELKTQYTKDKNRTSACNFKNRTGCSHKVMSAPVKTNLNV